MSTGGIFIGGVLPRKIVPEDEDPCSWKIFSGPGPHMATIRRNAGIKLWRMMTAGMIGAARIHACQKHFAP